MTARRVGFGALILLLAGCGVSSGPVATPSAAPTTSTRAVSLATTSTSIPPTTSGTVLLTTSTTAAPAPSSTVNGIAAEPRGDLTPGAVDPAVTQADIDSTICVSGYTATVRPPTSYTDRVKTERLAAYGYSQSKASFELDHLIPLELGGAPAAVANLWPEPWERSGLVPAGWGAETKDRFENDLHRAVCAHRVLLVDAQQQIATHWIAAADQIGIAAGRLAVRR